MLTTFRCKNTKCNAKFILAKHNGLTPIKHCPFCASIRVQEIQNEKKLADKMMWIIDAYI